MDVRILETRMPAIDNISEAAIHSFDERRRQVADIRERAQQLLAGGATGIQVCAAISESTDAFLAELIESNLTTLPTAHRQRLKAESAVVAIGGTGRGELAPYSDIDLVLLHTPRLAGEPFGSVAAQFIRDCWDSGLQLGHSVRTVNDALAMARQSPEFATALIEARLIWGSEGLFEQLIRKFRNRVVAPRWRSMLEACLAAREEEREQFGGTATKLEPDVKRSAGGLRDLHLIRWVGFIRHGVRDVDALRLEGLLEKRDAHNLLAAHEFLSKVRAELHFSAGRSSDVLTRDEQLRLASQMDVRSTNGLRGVERFMQTYFRHSTAVVDVARRFVALNVPRPLWRRFIDFLMTHRADGPLHVGPRGIDVPPRLRSEYCSRIENLLRLYQRGCLYSVLPDARMVEAIKQALSSLENAELSEGEARLFLSILANHGHLGATLRSMYETGLLDVILPAMRHARCLLQFNLYHSYTVDEHTLRAIEAVEQFDRGGGPLQSAYRAIKNKEMLHLALLLHDLGKGRDEDHSEVGRRLAEQTAAWLHLSEHQTELLVFLVHRHLLMAHLAFRRDTSDADILMNFAREVGSPETLQMLYVLTAADLQAVGPGIWTDWKAELLAEFYDRTMKILSGKPYRFLEEERIESVTKTVRRFFQSDRDPTTHADLDRWLETRIAAFPPHYLTGTAPERIAADLKVIETLQPGEIEIETSHDSDTGLQNYRLIAHERDVGCCFHRIAGALTAKRLQIVSAEIATTNDGYVLDSFHVVDDDHKGASPELRTTEVSTAIRAELTGIVSTVDMFRRTRWFTGVPGEQPTSDLPLRVVIDNDSSDRCTIIDVFAHDRPGLLYTIARIIRDENLSVMLAKISTHLDQIVDVFYVTDDKGHKLQDGERLSDIRQSLLNRLTEFESGGYTEFNPRR